MCVCEYIYTHIYIEDWVSVDLDGSYRCQACNKVITDLHLESSEHIRRLESWRDWNEVQQSGYQAPPQEHLAWVPADEAKPDGERWLKCLLCKKFVHDESSHIATWNDPSPSGSK